MITQSNYFEKVNSIDFDKLPSKLMEMHRYVKEITENHTTWKYYNWDNDIRETVDDYLTELNSFLSSKDLEGTRPQKKVRKTNKKNKQKQTKVQVAPNQVLPEPKQIEAKAPELVERISEEVKFIKRFVSMQSKEKNDSQILTFINTLQKAILEKRIRKTSIFAQEIKYIQMALVKLYNKFLSMPPSKRIAKIEIHPTNYKFLSAIAGSEKSRLSVNYLKRYIGIQGKKLSKEKVERLLEAMKNAADKRKMDVTDPYADRLRLVYKSLSMFLQSAKPNDTLEVHPGILNGINEELEGCACLEEKQTNLEGLEQKQEINAIAEIAQETEVMTPDQARKIEFEPVNITGKWLQLIGKFCLPTSFFVYGSGGSGKTSFVLLFTQYLASLGYKILYVAGEQFNTPSFTDTLNRLNIKGGDNFKIVGKIETLNPADFNFVVLDSKDALEIDIKDYLRLKEQFPEQSFIVIPHSIKSGKFKGKEQWRNVMEVMIEGSNGVIRTGHDKNRWGGAGEMKVFEPTINSQKAA